MTRKIEIRPITDTSKQVVVNFSAAFVRKERKGLTV